MSLVSDSPLHSSSSSGDFATLLEEELDVSSTSSLQEEEEDSNERKESDGNTSEDGESCRRKRLKLLEEIEVPSRPISDVTDNLQEIGNASILSAVETCPPHPGFISGLCFRCGKQMYEGEGSGVALGYIHKDLRLNTTEIDRVREADLKKLLREKKLVLVLDLDHTLLNSTRMADISPDEKYLLQDLNTPSNDVPSRGLFKLESMKLLTKLRPFVHTFLNEVSTMYEMYIYTMAERSYAVEIAKLLDPSGVYFHSKIISQSDCTQRYQKGLDVVLGAESTVLILDDTEMVWQKHRENLILMERYHYFASSCHQFRFNQVSLSVAKKDECEQNGVLPSVLKVLKRVHQLFFDPVLTTDLMARDVRKVLREVRQEVLQGCHVVFSRIFPSGAPAEEQSIWKRCEQLGAICSIEVDSSITHVISNDKGTKKARWAVMNEKFLVNPGWVEAAFHLWRRMLETDFPVK